MWSERNKRKDDQGDRTVKRTKRASLPVDFFGIVREHVEAGGVVVASSMVPSEFVIVLLEITESSCAFPFTRVPWRVGMLSIRGRGKS